MAVPASNSSSDDQWQFPNWSSHRWQKQLPAILLADDNVADHELVRRTFRDCCRVDIVTDGLGLLAYFEAEATDRTASGVHPDLILLDISMPGMNGIEVLPKIRATPRGALVPIVVFSSSEAAKDIRACYQAGCNSYVMKPFELHDYQRALELVANYWLGLSKSP